MISTNQVVGLLKFLSQLTKTHNLKSAYYLFFTFFALVKLNQLLKMHLKLHCIPQKLFSYLIMKHGKCNETQLDENLYILCNSNAIDRSKKWFYLCCSTSKQKYKVIVLSIDDVPDNSIYTSESLKLNITRQLSIEKSETTFYFLSKLF